MLFTMVLLQTHLIPEMTNQDHLMTESIEWEPTRSCAILRKAHEEERVPFAVACTLIETVSSMMLVVILVERWTTLLKSVACSMVILHLKSSVVQTDLRKTSEDQLAQIVESGAMALPV
ncbi:UNVERIFIED_CONTAM: hypothetical protein K2H54_052490 [Gekko kuhli]